MSRRTKLALESIQIRRNMIDGIMTGEASQLLGCDRRTFIRWAEKLEINPVMVLKSGKDRKFIYKRLDADRVSKAYKAFKESRKALLNDKPVQRRDTKKP